MRRLREQFREHQLATNARPDQLTQEHNNYVRETDLFLSGIHDRNEARERLNRRLMQAMCDVSTTVIRTVMEEFRSREEAESVFPPLPLRDRR